MKLADRESLLGKDQSILLINIFRNSNIFYIVGFYESKFAKHGQFKI